MRGVFVTGTGTGVGKTVAAAVIARGLAEAGRRVNVFKPALSGLDDPGEPDHLLLRRAARSDQAEDEVAPYRFGPPLSPHLAAELAGTAVEPGRVMEAAEQAAAEATLVCEGVGGLLVPLTRDWLVRDFARELGLPLVVVAAPALGTINHTLLTLEAARSAGLEVAAVVLNPWPAQAGRLELDNERTVRELGGVEVERLPDVDLADPSGWPALPAAMAATGA